MLEVGWRSDPLDLTKSMGCGIGKFSGVLAQRPAHPYFFERHPTG